MDIYTNLVPIHDASDTQISAGKGRYIIIKTANGMVHLVNIDNGTQGEIAKEYFEKEFELIN